MTAAANVYEGSCFCGTVRYRLEGQPKDMMNCHCTDCRKSHGAAFATLVEFPFKSLRFRQGEDNLATYTAASGTKRSFCKTCGSIVSVWSDADTAWLEVSASTLDTPIDMRPTHHIYVRSRAPWYEIRDDLPRHKASKDA